MPALPPYSRTIVADLPLFLVSPPLGEQTLSLADWMRLILSTEEGATGRAWRKKTVEPVFGQIKGCPVSPGFRQFLRRGLKKVRQERRFACAGHNIKKHLRHRSAIATAC